MAESNINHNVPAIPSNSTSIAPESSSTNLDIRSGTLQATETVRTNASFQQQLSRLDFRSAISVLSQVAHNFVPSRVTLTVPAEVARFNKALEKFENDKDPESRKYHLGWELRDAAKALSEGQTELLVKSLENPSISTDAKKVLITALSSRALDNPTALLTKLFESENINSEVKSELLDQLYYFHDSKTEIDSTEFIFDLVRKEKISGEVLDKAVKSMCDFPMHEMAEREVLYKLLKGGKLSNETENALIESLVNSAFSQCGTLDEVKELLDFKRAEGKDITKLGAGYVLAFGVCEPKQSAVLEQLAGQDTSPDRALAAARALTALAYHDGYSVNKAIDIGTDVLKKPFQDPYSAYHLAGLLVTLDVEKVLPKLLDILQSKESSATQRQVISMALRGLDPDLLKPDQIQSIKQALPAALKNVRASDAGIADLVQLASLFPSNEAIEPLIRLSKERFVNGDRTLNEQAYSLFFPTAGAREAFCSALSKCSEGLSLSDHAGLRAELARSRPSEFSKSYEWNEIETAVAKMAPKGTLINCLRNVEQAPDAMIRGALGAFEEGKLSEATDQVIGLLKSRVDLAYNVATALDSSGVILNSDQCRQLSKILKGLDPNKINQEPFLRVLARSGDPQARAEIMTKFGTEDLGSSVWRTAVQSKNWAEGTEAILNNLESGTLDDRQEIHRLISKYGSIETFIGEIESLAKEKLHLGDAKSGQEYSNYAQNLRKAGSMGFSNPLRFSKDELAEIVKNREEGATLGPGQDKLAVIVVPRSDSNGAFMGLKDNIADLIAKGYRVMVYEASQDFGLAPPGQMSLEQALLDGTYDRHSKKALQADLIIVAGHGSAEGIALGSADPRLGNKENTRGIVHLKDSERLKQLSGMLKDNGSIYLWSCSTSHKDYTLGIHESIARKFREAFPQAEVILAPIDPARPSSFKNYKQGPIRNLDRASNNSANDEIAFAA